MHFALPHKEAHQWSEYGLQKAEQVGITNGELRLVCPGPSLVILVPNHGRRQGKNMRRVQNVVAGLSCCLVALAVIAQAAKAEPPSFISVGVGYYDPIKGDRAAAEARIEYRHGERFWLFKPFAGATLTSDPSYFGYAGVLTDVYFGKRLVVSPSVAVGAYLRHGGKDMGSVFQIRSGLEIAYRFDSRSRLGVIFYHFSNAGLGDDRNPGSEAISLTYSIPLN